MGPGRLGVSGIFRLVVLLRNQTLMPRYDVMCLSVQMFESDERVQSEIFPMRYRAKGTSAATVSNWVWNAVVSKVAPLMLASINYWTYLVSSGSRSSLHHFRACREMDKRVPLQGGSVLD